MNAVHTYIRAIRTGYSVQSSYTDENLRKVMLKFAEHKCWYGEETIAVITEESMEEVAADGTSQTEELYLRIEKAKEVMSTYESLNYRERAIVADHLGFCRECCATHYYDENDLDTDGKPKRKARRKVPFIEPAVEHGLASPDTIGRTYRRTLKKMRHALSK